MTIPSFFTNIITFNFWHQANMSKINFGFTPSDWVIRAGMYLLAQPGLEFGYFFPAHDGFFICFGFEM